MPIEGVLIPSTSRSKSESSNLSLTDCFTLPPTPTGKLHNKKGKLEIKEILQPGLDAVLVAQNVAGQLERRIAFRKAVKQTVQRTIKAGAKGVKIQVSERLGGGEMSRTERDKEGRISLCTLRVDISYGLATALTSY